MAGPARRTTTRDERARVAAEHAMVQGGAVHRAQLRRAGIGRDDVRSEVAAGRWTVVGRHTVLIGTAERSAEAERWRAVWESGSGAVLDGAAALLASGLTGFRVDRLDVSMPHRNRHHRVTGVVLHRRRTMPPVVGAGLPRVRPPQAALNAASWAVSDRQAALILCMVVQQRLVRPEDLLAECRASGRRQRSRLIRLVVGDVADGAHSLCELDFVTMCHTRRLPSPTRQAVRTTADGRVYLDVAWEDIGLVVEIDGGHHAAALNPLDDALRQNDLVLDGSTVLRIPVIGLRLSPDRFLDQVQRAHAALSGRAA